MLLPNLTILYEKSWSLNLYQMYAMLSKSKNALD